MALVNALQNNPRDMLSQQAEGASRFMKIRSIWPFPVRGDQTDRADSDIPPEDHDESVAPSSFVT